MFISPVTAIERGWIKHPDCTTLQDWEDRKFVNPNAIDFTVDKLYKVSNHGRAIITEDERSFHSSTECEVDKNGNWSMQRDTLYDGMSAMVVEVPDNVACMLINRSSFNRCGVHLNAGMYDTHFHGNIGFTLMNRCGTVLTKAGTRVGQIIFITSESYGHYNGIYNNGVDKHWTDTIDTTIKTQ